MLTRVVPVDRLVVWVAATAVLLLSSVAVYCGGHAEGLPIRDPVPVYDLGILAQEVAEHLTAADFVESGVDRLHLSIRGGLLFVKGVVNRRSASRVHEALLSAPDVGVVVLTFVPGSADDTTNLELGLMLRQANYTTYVPADGMVASGGTDLFLAGVQRIVERGAMIGVHSWADSGAATGDTLDRDAEEHRIYLDYYRALAIDQEFYWFTLQAAPADEMHWMTDSEMAKYSVYTHLR